MALRSDCTHIGLNSATIPANAKQPLQTQTFVYIQNITSKQQQVQVKRKREFSRPTVVYLQEIIWTPEYTQ